MERYKKFMNSAILKNPKPVEDKEDKPMKKRIVQPPFQATLQEERKFLQEKFDADELWGK
jgi:hypothetical protein